MKKLLKILIKVTSILFIIIIFILFFALRFVDDTPYFETAYYQQTRSHLDGAIQNSKELKNSFRAGFGKVNITPHLAGDQDNPQKGSFRKVPLAGFSDSGESATAVHDSLFIKATALRIEDELVIFISGDLLLMPDEVVEEAATLLSESGIDREQLFFGASHTHSSVGAWSDSYVGEMSAGTYQRDIVKWLGRKITAAIIMAISDLREAAIASTSFRAPDLIKNRLIGKTGRLNDYFDFITIKQLNGRRCVIGSFSAHPTNYGSSNTLFSGDYPGYWQRKLETAGLDFAQWYGASLGSHSSKGKGRRFEKAKFIGESLADSVLAHLPALELRDTLSFTAISLPLQLPDLQIIRLQEDICLSSGLGEMLIPPVKNSYVQAIKLNNLLWLTQPCEISGEYSIDLKHALAKAGYNSMITSFNGQYLGYVVPGKYYNHDSYEPRLMSWFGPSFGDYLMEINYTLAGALSGVRL